MEALLSGVVGFLTSFWLWGAVVVLIVLKSSIKFVPQNRAYVIERFGKYNKTMEAGLNFRVPVIERVAYDRSLKEQAIDVPSQGAITRDNITLTIDGVLYIKVLDPQLASYGVDDYKFAVTQLAQTTMRSEIGKLELDKTFEEREQLNAAIVTQINEASGNWGVQVMRYEIKDIVPPRSTLEAMERQMKAEREKRAAILESEGERQSAINRAEGEKRSRILRAEGERQEVVLQAEADKQKQILEADGKAQAITTVADAKAKAIETVGEAAATEKGQKAVQLTLAEGAIKAREAIAQPSDGKLILMEGGNTEVGTVVAQALGISTAISQTANGTDAGEAAVDAVA